MIKGRRRFTEQERSAYLARFERSGLSATEFCRRAKIHMSTFSFWRRTSAGRPLAAPTFAEVRLNGTSPMTGAVTLHLPSGARLEVPAGTEAAWRGLGLLLKSLDS
jgi:transposase-like protein